MVPNYIASLLEPTEHTWLLDFNLFVKELENNLGSYVPIGKAGAKIEEICMQENHQAVKWLSVNPYLYSVGVLRSVCHTILSVLRVWRGALDVGFSSCTAPAYYTVSKYFKWI